MKKFYSILFIGVILSFSLQAQKNKSNMDSLSYSIGILFGNSLKQQGLDKINSKDLSDGLEAILNNKPTSISKEQATQTQI